VSILDSLLSVASGGITGLIGTAVQGYYTYKSKQLDIQLEQSKFSHELEQRKLDAVIMEKEYAARTQIADITATAEVDKADAAALAASYATEPQQYSEKSLLTHAQNWILVLLDAFRAVIRPSLTLYLCAITTVIYLQARALLGTDLPSDIAAGLVTKIIDTILFLTVTAVTWWYGSRAHGKK
jgi:hypothetical protein